MTNLQNRLRNQPNLNERPMARGARDCVQFRAVSNTVQRSDFFRFLHSLPTQGELLALTGYSTLFDWSKGACPAGPSKHRSADYRQLERRRGGITKIERLIIPGPAGDLESLLEFDPETPPRMTAVVCHPHPLYGGAMHNKVVFRAARAARAAGMPALRFNFRGVGRSQGKYANGEGEQGDVQAALDYLGMRFGNRPACVLGFSFGAWVGLRVGAQDPRVTALVGLGFPTSDLDFSYLRRTTKPKLIVQGSRDQYGWHEAVQAIFDELSEPKQIHWVQNADHFFTGHLEEVESVVHKFLIGIAGGLPVDPH